MSDAALPTRQVTREIPCNDLTGRALSDAFVAVATLLRVSQQLAEQAEQMRVDAILPVLRMLGIAEGTIVGVRPVDTQGSGYVLRVVTNELADTS